MNAQHEKKLEHTTQFSYFRSKKNTAETEGKY